MTEEGHDRFRDQTPSSIDEWYRELGSFGAWSPVLVVLKAHLACEYLLELLIVDLFPRGGKLAKKRGLSFAIKLSIVEATGVLPAGLVKSLSALNDLRNGCAHVRKREITEADIDRIGRPLDDQLGLDWYESNRKASAGSVDVLTASTLAYVAGFLSQLVGRTSPDDN